jgi:hypothetical protein
VTAQTPDKYQVTGQVVEVSDSMIVVMKGRALRDGARCLDEVTGDLKVGANHGQVQDHRDDRGVKAAVAARASSPEHDGSRGSRKT